MTHKYLTTFLPGIAATLLLTACATTTNYDYRKGYDFNAIRSIRIITPQQASSPDTRINSPLVLERIDNTLAGILSARGYHVVDTDADAELHYQIGTRSGLDSYGSGFSFGFGHFHRHSAVGIGYAFPDYDVESYDESVLTVDIKQPGDSSLLWRGSSSQRLYDGITPEKLDETVFRLVNETLANFPPGRRDEGSR